MEGSSGLRWKRCPGLQSGQEILRANVGKGLREGRRQKGGRANDKKQKKDRQKDEERQDDRKVQREGKVCYGNVQ